MKIITISVSNAAPSWPHELHVKDTVRNTGWTKPYGSLDRMIWEAQKQKDEANGEVIIKLERIICTSQHIRTE